MPSPIHKNSLWMGWVETKSCKKYEKNIIKNGALCKIKTRTCSSNLLCLYLFILTSLFYGRNESFRYWKMIMEKTRLITSSPQLISSHMISPHQLSNRFIFNLIFFIFFFLVNLFFRFSFIRVACILSFAALPNPNEQKKH